LCPLQTFGEIGGRSAGEEVAVRIVPVWQLDDVGAYADALEAQGELVRTLLAGLRRGCSAS
jgi:hypothetical protein